MVWFVKLLLENENILLIAYSYNTDDLDGRIEYNKTKEEFFIKKQSTTADEYDSKKTIQFLWNLIGTDKLSEEPYRICTG